MSDTQANELIKRIQQDMRQAMKDRDATKLSILRALSAQLSNAEAIQTTATTTTGVGSTEAARRQLTIDDVQRIITAEVREIEAALDAIEATSPYAAELRQKIAIIQTYLIA